MKLYEAPKSRDTHFLGAKDRYPAEPTLCGRKPSVGVLVGAYHQAHSISERMPFEHVVFYFNNFNLVVIIRIFFGYFQNSASCILSTDSNVYDMKCLIILQLP